MAVIAITCGHNYQEGYSHIAGGYIEAVEEAGGLAAVLPPTLSPGASRDLLSRMDGLLLTGGNDIFPGHYSQQANPDLGKLDPLRDEQEFALAQEAVKMGLPILGICRGMQVANVALGGSLHQHIGFAPGELQHRQNAPNWHRQHEVDILEGTRLANILGAGKIRVNSLHHQAVDRVAPGLQVSAVAPDGIIEALEGAAPWFLGMQWHPEMMFKRYREFLLIFQAFVSACRGTGNGH